MLEEEQAKMNDAVFFAPLNPIFESEPGEELTSDDFTKPRMEHIEASGDHKTKLQFWQTRSNAIFVYSSMPPECIYKVISRHGERVLFEIRDASTSTKSCALKRSWQTQQQQGTSGSASARSWKQSAEILVKEEMKKNPGNSTEQSETSRSRKLLRSDVPNIKDFFGGMPCTRLVRYRAPTPRLSVCGWLAAQVCEAFRNRVMEEEGQVFSLSNDTESTMASMFKQVGCQVSLGRWSAAHFPCKTMEEVFFGSVWNMISLLLTTDDVVKVRTAACLWNVGDKYGLPWDSCRNLKCVKQDKDTWTLVGFTFVHGWMKHDATAGQLSMKKVFFCGRHVPESEMETWVVGIPQSR